MDKFNAKPEQIKIGIDPGLEGAVAWVTAGKKRLMNVKDLPLIPEGKKMQINEAELTRMLRGLDPSSVCVYLEQVGAMPKQGVTSMFNFGVGYGIIRGIVVALGYPLVLIRPANWKREAGIIRRDKDAARTLAQHLYPEAPLGRKKDVGRADAILIARFGQ